MPEPEAMSIISTFQLENGSVYWHDRSNTHSVVFQTTHTYSNKKNCNNLNKILYFDLSVYLCIFSHRGRLFMMIAKSLKNSLKRQRSHPDDLQIKRYSSSSERNIVQKKREGFEV